MLTPTLMLMAALSNASMAAPDKFWLEAPNDAAVEGSQPAVIEGVVIEEDDASVLIRVVGGEVRLDRAQIVRVDKDKLNVQAIERAERKAAEERAAARAEAAEGESAGEQTNVEWIVETPKCCDDDEDDDCCEERCCDDDACCDHPAPFYDPVLHVLRVHPCVDDYTLIRDLMFAYELTRDRTYLKMLRKLRRLR